MPGTTPTPPPRTRRVLVRLLVVGFALGANLLALSTVATSLGWTPFARSGGYATPAAAPVEADPVTVLAVPPTVALPALPAPALVSVADITGVEPQPVRTAKPPVPSKAAATPTQAPFADCAAAASAGAAPLHRGDPGWADDLDSDGDGVACD